MAKSKPPRVKSESTRRLSRARQNATDVLLCSSFSGSLRCHKVEHDNKGYYPSAGSEALPRSLRDTRFARYGDIALYLPARGIAPTVIDEAPLLNYHQRLSASLLSRTDSTMETPADGLS